MDDGERRAQFVRNGRQELVFEAVQFAQRSRFGRLLDQLIGLLPELTLGNGEAHPIQGGRGVCGEERQQFECLLP